MAEVEGILAGIESPNKRAKMDSGLSATNFDESKFARYYRTVAVSSANSSHSATVAVTESTSAPTYYSFPYAQNSIPSYSFSYAAQNESSPVYTYNTAYGYDFNSLNGYHTGYSTSTGISSTTLTPSVTCSLTSSSAFPLSTSNVAHHNTPPSRVIHCRAVADGCKETDLIQVLQPFGTITYVTLLPKIRQALVEFESLESAIAVVTYSQTSPLTVLGRQMFVNYSKSQEIKRDKVLNGDSNGACAEASNILLLTIINPLHPINVKILHKICSPSGKVLRIVIFHKNGLQALVEFDSVESAERALAVLNGQDIYAGCCTLKIDYSKKAKKLNVFKNDDETWDYTGALNGTSGIPSKTALLGTGLLSAISGNDSPDSSELNSPPNGTISSMNGKLTENLGSTSSSIPLSTEVIARAAAFPTVQSILAKVASLQSNKSPTGSSPSPPGLTAESAKTLLGLSPFSLSQPGLLGALPGLSQQTQLTNGVHASAMSSPTLSSPDWGKSVSRVWPGLEAQPAQTPTTTQVSTQALSTAGGTGCVLMVYGLNHEKMNCERIFNLFCLYGNVIKVKFLTNKPGACMVQMSDKIASEMIIRNLSGATIFDNKINIMFSKHPFIADSSVVTALPDSSPSAMNFADNRNNRFKYLPEGQSLKNRYQPPTRMLHFFNAPPNCTVDQLRDVFVKAGALAPLKGTFFSKANTKSSAGLLEMPDIRSAMEALILTNHYTINPPGGGSFTLKLAFSPSSSISPTAPTVAPAVAAAAVAAASITGNPLGPIGSPMHVLTTPGSPNGMMPNGGMDLNDMEQHLGSPEHKSASP
ncbi:heterogeneous nuclear ribonucleoprotein L-like isoform X2 [Nematostella vectensis]|uniref:heterogeneous nuclear ribonucleoprotein L-like isoform X2 n=1 Tax=Nematostella vectensis TaxID=45351 RepID=UPI002076F452|nr:heterogeneous nuclear ribonucleoprotein L-like isoform X2 [Nematostella vectensis]